MRFTNQRLRVCLTSFAILYNCSKDLTTHVVGSIRFSSACGHWPGQYNLNAEFVQEDIGSLINEDVKLGNFANRKKKNQKT